MTKKAAIEFAKRESHNKKIRVITWHKETVLPKGPRHEIAILVWEYDTAFSVDGAQTFTRLKLFIDGKPRYGDYID